MRLVPLDFFYDQADHVELLQQLQSVVVAPNKIDQLDV